MTTVDVSLIQNYLPILSFLLVFTVVFAVLTKYKDKVLGESKFVNLFVSFIVATMFVSVISAREYVVSITPWFAVFVITLIFISILVSFTGKASEGLSKNLSIAFVFALLIVFLVSAYYTFSVAPFFNTLGVWISKPGVYGTILLLVSSAIVSWVLVKAK